MTKKFAISVFEALLSATALSAADNMLVASSASHTIEEFSPSGGWMKTFATTGGYAPVAIAQSPLTGEFFVTVEIPSGDSNHILRYHADGTFDANWDTFTVTCENCGGGGTESLLFDSQGDLYVATHYGDPVGPTWAVNIYKYMASDLVQPNPQQVPTVIYTKMIRGDQMAFRSASEICIAGFIDEDVKCFNTSSGAQTADYYAGNPCLESQPHHRTGGISIRFGRPHVSD